MSFVWLQSLKLWDLVEFWDQEAGLWMEIGIFSWAGGSLNLVTGSQYLQMAFNVFSLAAKYGTLGFRGDERSRYGSLDRGWIYESDDGMVTSLFVQPKYGDYDFLEEASTTVVDSWKLFVEKKSKLRHYCRSHFAGESHEYKFRLSHPAISALNNWIASFLFSIDLLNRECQMFVFELKFLPFGTYDSDDVFGEWTALDNNFCLEESRVSPPIDVYLVKTTMSYYNSLSTSGASPLEIVKEDTEFERTALSFYLHECSMLEHITKFAVKTTLDFYSSFSKNNASPLCEWVDDPHGLVNCWIELRVPNSDSFLLFTVNGYDDGFHLIESFAFTSLRSVVNLTLLPSGSIRQTGDRVFLSEILPQSDKEVSDENMRCETVKEDVVSEIVKEDLGNANEIVSDKEVSDENMRGEIDEKMVSETVKEGVASEIVKEDLGNADEIVSEIVKEDLGNADEIVSDKEVSDENMRSEIDEKMVSETVKEGVVSEIVKEDLGNADEIVSDKEVSDENMRSEMDEKMVSETVKEGVVSEIVKEDLGNVDEIVSDREVSDENMRSEIVKKDLVKHANEIDEKMVSETVKEELVSEIVKEDLVKDSDEIDENRRSENVREDVKHADEIRQAQHLDNVTKDLVKETADAQTDIEESVKECAEKATEAYLDRIRRQYIADQHKKRDELAEVVRKLTLETQQRDW
ncbi:hypothetical protein F2Q70_00024750 [Brassica cretica]|uniref:Uncharacterized protein n=1 Tax=Brassica cretica TaxID=69181 RepID=A0A8S9L2V5_BRACR|nr:hypothetical protein F2Q70_00024750 [Brassica cretica]